MFGVLLGKNYMLKILIVWQYTKFYLSKLENNLQKFSNKSFVSIPDFPYNRPGNNQWFIFSILSKEETKVSTPWSLINIYLT